MQYFEEELEAKVVVRRPYWKSEAGLEKSAKWEGCVSWKTTECS